MSLRSWMNWQSRLSWLWRRKKAWLVLLKSASMPFKLSMSLLRQSKSRFRVPSGKIGTLHKLNSLTSWTRTSLRRSLSKASCSTSWTRRWLSWTRERTNARNSDARSTSLKKRTLSRKLRWENLLSDLTRKRQRWQRWSHLRTVKRRRVEVIRPL